MDPSRRYGWLARNLLLTRVGVRKIENFIRTKYESKRWIMDGPMPDPSTLDDGDDDVVRFLASFYGG